MIAAALTSPCLIRSDGRTITIEKPQFIECADGRFSAGVAGIPLRHATYSGTDLEQGRVAPSQSPSAVPTARDPNSNVPPPVHEKASACQAVEMRTEDRREGKELVSKSRSRCSAVQYK